MENWIVNETMTSLCWSLIWQKEGSESPKVAIKQYCSCVDSLAYYEGKDCKL